MEILATKSPKEGISDGGDDGDGGRIFPGHPGPILNSRKDNISRKGNPSLRYVTAPIRDRSEGI